MIKYCYVKILLEYSNKVFVHPTYAKLSWSRLC